MSTATKLISKKHVRQFALDASKGRHHKFALVGDGFFVKCEAHLRTFIAAHVAALPSKGKTIL
jgi:hypothetical protein